MHNTLASSDYGLLSEDTLEPRPNYWAALLWKRTMGAEVLDPGVPRGGSLRVFAHCLAVSKGGVALLALNTDRNEEQFLTVPVSGEMLTLTAAGLESRQVSLNGAELHAGSDGSVPSLKGQRMEAGTVPLPPASITFLMLPTAGNKSCM